MKYFEKLTIQIGNSLLAIFALTLYPSTVLANTLESTDYMINGATINSGAEVTDSGGSGYLLHSSIGDFSGDPRLNSASYSLKNGVPNTFTANVPLITCFETVTDGTSDCIDAPAYLVADGMVTICGYDGCYDKARIEIDPQNNPSDTLYGIQISTDNFVSDIRVIDWTTRAPISFGSRTIDDYKTENEWEDYDDSYSTSWTNSYNVQGLDPDQIYYVRVTALHGDFTESEASPILNSTTSLPSLSLDLDIDTTAGVATENSSPYTVALSLTAGNVITSNNLVWIDINSNASQGITLAQRGVYGGLFSPGYTIDSATANLTAASEGFGLQSYTATEQFVSPAGELSSLSVETDYSGTSQFVGEISTSLLDVYTSGGPIYGGRASMYVKAKSSITTDLGSYTEQISFILIPQY